MTKPMMRIRMMRIRLLLLSFVGLASLAWGQGFYAIEPAPLKTSVPFSTALRKSLDPHGTRVVTSAGEGEKTTVCEVWWSKVVFADAKARGPEDASYSNLQLGTLLGVVYYPSPVVDAQGQKLRPGYYTMRYVELPQDKAHETVLTYPDFVILSPAADDVKKHETLPMDALLQLGRQASQTRHPAVTGLVPVNPGYQDFPGIVPQQTGEATLQVKLKTRTGNKASEDLKLAIVLVTAPKRDIGS
jgi:hypothetical protein